MTEQITDQLETLILMALDANHGHTGPRTIRRDKSTGAVQELLDQGELLRFDAMYPSSAYTVDMLDQERIFAASPGYLVAHPAEILGQQSEMVILNGDYLKWYGFRRLNSRPRGIDYLGKASHWYEVHMRIVSINGQGEYYKRVVPINRDGYPLAAKVQGHIVCSPSIEGVTLISAASVIEDAHREGTMLAEVKDATQIKFPVPLGDYKKVFAEREGPLNGSRRKSIVHWVAKHLRKSTRGNVHEVERHVRGVQEFSIDGLQIRLTPNAGLPISMKP